MATRSPASSGSAVYADLEALPPELLGQILGGELVALPRPGFSHTAVASRLGEELGPPFRRGSGGPGGWVLLDEPELHLGGDVLVPDLAGWRRERWPGAPETPYLTLAPDWVCEIVSPSSVRIDRVEKPRIYAREAVTWVWILDAEARSLEVLQLDGGSYRLLSAFDDSTPFRAAPFDALDLSLTELLNV